jgi:hypothetical protein
MLVAFYADMFPIIRNNVATVARLWAELITADGTRFKGSFDRVIFAILDAKTFATFKGAFEEETQTSSDS